MPRVLVVDDEPDVVTLLRLLFEGAGYETVVPSSCERAGEEAAVLLPDLILLDVRMPPTSGWEVMAKVRANPLTRSTPIIMVSATDQVDERVRAIREGADDFVAKPFDGPELLARAERVRARTRHNGGEGSAADLRGSLESYPLHVLLQAVAQQRHSGRLELRGGVEPSYVVFEQGAPVAARAGVLAGEEALWSLLERTSGQFTYAAGPTSGAPSSANLQRSVQSLLLDAAWVEDELSRRQHLLPAPQQPLYLREGEVYGAEEDARVLVDAVREALRAHPGLSLSELIERLPLAPTRVRFAISLLVDHDLITETPGARTAPAPSISPTPSALSLCVLLTAEAVPEALRLLERLPPESPPESSLSGGLPAEGVRVALRDGDALVEVWLYPFEMRSVAAIFGRAKQSSAVLLWAGGSSSELVIPPRLLAAAAGRDVRLTILNAGPELKEKLGGSSARLDGAWKHAEARPENVVELVRLAFAESEVSRDTHPASHR